MDFLGADRVIVGSDWPLHPTPSRQTLDALFDQVGLDGTQRALVASRHVERLLAASELGKRRLSFSLD